MENKILEKFQSSPKRLDAPAQKMFQKAIEYSKPATKQYIKFVKIGACCPVFVFRNPQPTKSKIHLLYTLVLSTRSNGNEDCLNVRSTRSTLHSTKGLN
ncbi:hypothetical protein L596_001782 [Steinernema carpocapsae]|uniref:Uncharacterized protein n=1 Tax=Steinernema carpocapsae TaxID=34508 RepID=A0A4U8UMI3_STECR|nr:hypothetical protein L596_001782 [Steinernema carpocapsae]